jgi:hypothetical protein
MAAASTRERPHKGVRGAAGRDLSMHIPWLPARGSRRAQLKRSASNGLIVLASAALLTTGLVTPVAAQSRTSAGVASAPHKDIARMVGKGTHVDARQAARDAAMAPRVHKELKHPKVDLGARAATKVTTPSTRNLAGTSRTGAAIGTGGPRIVSQPTPVITTTFAGIAESEVCTCEPPDPWIAVSPSYVVQSTNGMIRISSRAGSTLMSEPTWALFAVPVDRGDSDPRILWDAVHGRWVGVITTYNGDFSQNGLRLAVSETADPTAGWIVYPIEYGNYLADYPGISTSSTRIVLTSDDFLNASSFSGPTFLVVDWSNILAGTSLFVGGQSFNTTLFGHFRPAIVLSSAVNTPLIYENGISPWYVEIAGSASTAFATNEFNLHATFGVSDFSLPTPPVQPGGVTITTAADERPTDAVYRNGSLWFVATGDSFDGTDHWDVARYTVVSTTANNIAPTAAVDLPGASPGTHYFMPGVGINADGSVFLTATKTDPTSVYPTTVVGAVLAGSGFSPYADIEASTVAYTGDRWGDYVGVAADPSGAGAVWVEHELVASDGTWRTSVIRVVSDGTVPGAPGTVSQAPVVASTLGATIPVRTSWGAASDADSGVVKYLVERSDDGGISYFGVTTPSASITQPLLVGRLVRYRISAIDAVGNIGAPTYGPLYRPTLYQSNTSATVYTTGWGSSTSTSFSGGSAKYSSTAGKYATFTATSARSIAIVATKAKTRGSFKVYVDGVYKGTISCYSTTTKYRQLVYQFSWSTAGTHKVKIVVSGTSGRPRVDLDAFVVLR